MLDIYDIDKMRHTWAHPETRTYLIDGQQRRIGKLVNGVLVQGFLYQDEFRLVAELKGTGQVVTSLEKYNSDPHFMLLF